MKKIISLFIIITILFSFTVEVSAATINTKITVAAPMTFNASEGYDRVIIKWSRNSKADGYVISRSTKYGSFKKLVTFRDNKTTEFVDKTANEDTLYYYSIKAFKKANGKTYFSKSSTIVPIFFGVNLYLSSFSNSVNLNWSRIKSASGYEIYYSTDGEKYSRIKTIKDNKQITYTKTKVTPFENDYYFCLKAYKNTSKGKQYIYKSEKLCSSDVDAFINASVSTPKKSFKCYNVQGKKAYVAYNVTLTNKQKNIFSEFNRIRLTADMSPCQRIFEVFKYIHKETVYASGALYSQISSLTYTEAVFDKNLGQCLQYNGAMLEYLANLGFDVKLIWGYRGTSMNNKWQHFWGQVKLNNGKNYVVETGNYGNDGDWYYFFTPYANTKKYLKCGKYVSGIK